MSFPTLDDLDVANKRVLVRMDLNVPMQSGSVTDTTRVVRLLPTLKELLKKKARIIVLSHLGRPKGKYEPDLTLAPLVDALHDALKAELRQDVPIHFGVDCIGPEAKAAVKALKSGEILLLENLRFHAGEEKNDADFAKALAAHGDVYLDDAFACAHRAHASLVAITKYLPSAAGRLMEEELGTLEKLLSEPKEPFTAIVGGAKISSKIDLLEHLVSKVDHLIIGGAMAHTFLLAQGLSVGKSLAEPDFKATAKRIFAMAEKKHCTIHLPVDAVVTYGETSGIYGIDAIPGHGSIFDVGNLTLQHITQVLEKSRTVIWNGPLGMFDSKTAAFSSLWVAREIARLTRRKSLISVAGGGETVEAINKADMMAQFTYVSTAGGAFLEWLEGKTLPGVAALQRTASHKERIRL